MGLRPAAAAPEWLRLGRPGEPDFNRDARELLRAAKLPRLLTCAAGDRWYQHTLKFLTDAESPIKRLLVVWQLGAGKTIGMLRVLDNYFDDQRPKLLLFPTSAVADNFYLELGRRPNRYRTHLEDRGIVLNEGDEDGYVTAARKFLHRWPIQLNFKNEFSELEGPLRAFTYAEAATDKFIEDTLVNWPPDFKARRRSAPNGRLCLSDMIVVCDEAHNQGF